MVLELLVNPKKVQGKLWEVFFLGFAYSFIAVFLSFWIFRNYVSLIMITITVIAAVPFVHSIISREEKKELKIKEEKKLFKEHEKAILMFVFLFLGFVASFLLVYLILPAEITSKVFDVQLETVLAVKSAMPTGNFIANFNTISIIFLNNLKILFFCILFSFFYGAGAIFILTWNASVMATAIGSFIKEKMIEASGIAGYFNITTVGLLQYFLHGMPEIIAYFLGALASGIISIALIRHDFRDNNFKRITKDAFDLVLLAIFILFIAALIEVFISPLLL